MYRKSWDVQDLIGQHACVRLIDENPGDISWGHINFDDLKGDIICPQDWGKFQFQGCTRTFHVVNENRFILHGFKIITGNFVEGYDGDNRPPSPPPPG